MVLTVKGDRWLVRATREGQIGIGESSRQYSILSNFHQATACVFSDAVLRLGTSAQSAATICSKVGGQGIVNKVDRTPRRHQSHIPRLRIQRQSRLHNGTVAGLDPTFTSRRLSTIVVRSSRDACSTRFHERDERVGQRQAAQ